MMGPGSNSPAPAGLPQHAAAAGPAISAGLHGLRRARPSAPAPTVIVADPAWRRLIRDAERLAIRAAMQAGGAGTIVLSSDREVKRLNGRHRGKYKPTNVLTFDFHAAPMPLPALQAPARAVEKDAAPEAPGKDRDRPRQAEASAVTPSGFPTHGFAGQGFAGQNLPGQGFLGGDIVLALGTVRREALAARRPPAHHLAHLIVHGALHLRGHDHHAAGEARRMEMAEARILARLGVPNPWKRR